VIEDDPDDNMVLECAMEAGVSIVVSGDAHLLAGR
jgi:predicted nucleic acid-binding protein